MKIFHPAILLIAILTPPCFAAAAGTSRQPGNERQQQLRQILSQDCSVCHGESLQGDLGPALTAESLAGKSEDELVQTIMEGHDETAMPPWWWMLDGNDARWLVQYIRGGKAARK